jgi:hypothetical protein
MYNFRLCDICDGNKGTAGEQKCGNVYIKRRLLARKGGTILITIVSVTGNAKPVNLHMKRNDYATVDDNGNDKIIKFNYFIKMFASR